MKKWLIGCGIIFLFCVVICGGLTFFGVHKLNQWTGKWEQIKKDYQQLEQKYPFTIPEEPDLTTGRIDDYFEIRLKVADLVSSNTVLAEFAAAHKNKKQPNFGPTDMMQLAFKFSQQAAVFFHDELDAKQMSFSEYSYYTRMTYMALAKGAEEGDPELQALFDELGAQVDEINQALQKSNNKQYVVYYKELMQKLVEEEVPLTAMDEAAMKKHASQLMEYPLIAFVELFLLANESQFRKGGGGYQPVYTQPTSQPAEKPE
jgi:hypothetical protein